MINPAELTLNRPIATLMLAIAISVFGYISYQQLPVNLLPDVSYPTLTVRTEQAGAAPAEIERNISEPIEQILRTVEGVVSVESISRAGQSDVVLRFTWNTDMDDAIQKVRERVQIVPLDESIETPLILRFDPDLDPMMRIGMASRGDSGVPISDLRRLAENDLEPAIQKLEGVAMVRVRGGANAIVRVEVDTEKLARAGLSITDVSNRLQTENVNLAGGALAEGNVTYLVRTLNAFDDLDDIRNLSLVNLEGATVSLSQVASVSMGREELEIVTRLGVDGVVTDSVILEVFREPDANLVDVSRRVHEALYGDKKQLTSRANRLGKDRGLRIGTQAKLLASGKSGVVSGLPPIRSSILADRIGAQIDINVLSDQSTFIERSVDEVTNAALWGSLFAILVLFGFLRDLWSTMIIAIAIPLSVIATFGAMRLFGVSLNVMSLGGIALGIGMLVDNSIVVLESIVRCKQEGDGALNAARRGTEEVAGAVIASTLTSLAVFLPIVFIDGVGGQIFRDLALSVVFSLTASLGVAMLFVPMLSARNLTEFGDRSVRRESGGSAIAEAKDDFTYWKTRFSGGGVILALAPVVFLFLFVRTILGVILELVFVRILGTVAGWFATLFGIVIRFLGNNTAKKRTLSDHPLYRSALQTTLRSRWVVISLAIVLFAIAVWRFDSLGTRLLPNLNQGVFEVVVQLPIGTRLEETARRVAPLEDQLAKRDTIRRFSTVVGVERSELSEDGGEHTARILIELERSDDPEQNERNEMAFVRNISQELAGATIQLRRPTLLSLNAPIDVQLFHPDLRLLRRYGDRVETALEGTGVSDVRNRLQRGFPEVQIRLNRERLAALGLSAQQVGNAIRTQVQGTRSTELQDERGNIDVIVRTERDQLPDVDALKRLVIANDISLGVVGRIETAEGPSEIRHIGGRRATTIIADVPIASVSAVSDEISNRLSEISLPTGMSYVIAGQSGETDRAIRNLLWALALAIFLVYVVLASKFESFRGPFIILLSIPLAIVGVTAALELASMHLSVLVFVGLIMLAGIVVNNAIVLVDYTNQRVALSDDFEQGIIDACAIRLRPVLITTTTTVLGLLPMAFGIGDGSELRQPLAITVIAGLLSSTLLTLFVIPALYRIFIPKPAESEPLAPSDSNP